MSDAKFSGSTPIDPVCGMEVTPESVFRATYKGQDYNFCSLRCLSEFQKNPGKYLTPFLFLDPVCCLSVTSESEFRATYQGNEFIFCSQRCLSKFHKEPEKYIAATVEYFTCPKHPGVRQTEPGECPQCGMPLAAVRTKWICPYHPQMLYDMPGVCPIYGMDLVPDPPGRFYCCDRHPKVKQLEPGKCPQCGIFLRPSWAPVCLISECPVTESRLRAAMRNCPRCGIKMEPSMGPEQKAEEHVVVCPKCGLIVAHD
jgi:YHS domain-containing protein/ribosomal protein S27AE